jgi:hypothetical protein
MKREPSSPPRPFPRAPRRRRAAAASALGAAALVLSLFPGRESPALIIPFTDEELANICARISVGTVVGVTTTWNPTHEYIWTAVTLDVDYDVKGSGPDPLVIRTYGGTVGDTTMVAVESPAFETGERVAVFLMPFEASEYYVRGGPGGRFTIVGGVVIETGETETAFVDRILSYL